jgi:hypothetical protein
MGGKLPPLDPMTYALLQTSMDPTPVDALRRAFRNSNSLASADATFVADDAFGILARDIPEDEAQSLAASLMGEGIEVELVAENRLPRIPEPRFFLSAQIQNGTLDLFDALERSETVPWPALRLMAVGHDQREVRLELVVGDSIMRFFTTINRFHYHHIPDIKGLSNSEKLVQLVRKIYQHCPNILLNRGASILLEDIASERLQELVAYPRHSAYLEEITWLLWRARALEESTPFTASEA